MTDVGDPEAVAARKKRIKTQRFQELEDIRELMKSRAGRAVLWRVLKHCEPMAINHRVDNSVFLIEGRRAVGLWLISELTAADNRAYILLQEQAEHEARQILGDDEQ